MVWHGAAMTEDKGFIKIKDLAKQLHRDRSVVLKRLKKLGYEIGYAYDENDESARGQKLAVVRKKDVYGFLASLYKVEWAKNTRKRSGKQPL